MEFSFIILTWNSDKYIDTCIDSIFAEGRLLQVPFDIYVIDNGSSDSTPAKIRKYNQHYPEVIKPIYLRTNVGTTQSRNMALRKAKGKYIIILDSDIKLLPGVIYGLQGTLTQRPDVGLVVPRLIYPDGRHQKSVDIFPTITHKIKRFFLLKKMEQEERPITAENGLIEVDYAISALWMLPRTIIDRVGLLDENIFYSPEDVDYCLRIWKAGYRIVIDPRLVALHDAQEISRGFRIGKSTILHAIGLFYFFRKHRYFFNKPNFT